MHGLFLKCCTRLSKDCGKPRTLPPNSLSQSLPSPCAAPRPPGSGPCSLSDSAGEKQLSAGFAVGLSLLHETSPGRCQARGRPWGAERCGALPALDPGLPALLPGDPFQAQAPLPLLPTGAPLSHRQRASLGAWVWVEGQGL